VSESIAFLIAGVQPHQAGVERNKRWTAHSATNTRSRPDRMADSARMLHQATNHVEPAAGRRMNKTWRQRQRPPQMHRQRKSPNFHVCGLNFSDSGRSARILAMVSVMAEGEDRSGGLGMEFTLRGRERDIWGTRQPLTFLRPGGFLSVPRYCQQNDTIL
jgi:hypothetical protein